MQSLDGYLNIHHNLIMDHGEIFHSCLIAYLMMQGRLHHHALLLTSLEILSTLMFIFAKRFHPTWNSIHTPHFFVKTKDFHPIVLCTSSQWIKCYPRSYQQSFPIFSKKISALLATNYGPYYGWMNAGLFVTSICSMLIIQSSGPYLYS